MRSYRLDEVKDQLHILYIGLVIEEAHHACSKDCHTYKVGDLFKHIVETAIPLYVNLKRKEKFPIVAPLKEPCLSNVAMLGTISELGNELYKKNRD